MVRSNSHPRGTIIVIVLLALASLGVPGCDEDPAQETDPTIEDVDSNRGKSTKATPESGRTQNLPSVDSLLDSDWAPKNLESRIQTVYRHVAGATVAVRSPSGDRSYGSGAIISPEGLVLTTGHHRLEPNARVKVLLGNGRQTMGTMLGVHEPCDISLIQLDGTMSWPSVALGASETLSINDPCVALGYPVGYRDDLGRAPVENRPPLMRIGRILKVTATQILTTAQTEGGDSGGPLFALDGQLIGVHGLSPGELHGAGHSRVELFQQVRDELLAGRHIRQGALSGPFPDKTSPFSTATEVGKSVVGLEVDKERCAFGMILSPDGWIVSKRSLCRMEMTCRLWNGQTFPAKLFNESREYDLALLKIDGDNLAEISWSDRVPRPGLLLASVTTGGNNVVEGVVGAPVTRLAPERGYVFVETEATNGAQGVRVSGVGPFPTPSRLEVGDIITHVEDVPTATHSDYLREVEHHLSTKIVGESLDMTVKRNGQELHLNVPIESGVGEPYGRHSGFPSVFIHDASIRRGRLLESENADLGGPIVDRKGRVLGINIAISRTDCTYAIPASDVQQELVKLRKRDSSGRP